MPRSCLVPMRILALALFVSAVVPSVSAAATGTLHVCVGEGGVRSYQDTPCAAGQRTLGERSFARAAVDPALAARTRAIEAEMDRRHRGGGARAAAVRSASRRPSPPSLSPCAAAKAERRATLERVGLKRDFDLLSRLDGAVWSACKGF